MYGVHCAPSEEATSSEVEVTMAYMNQSKNLLDKHMRDSIYTFLHGTVMQEKGSMRIDEFCFNVGRQEGRCDIVVVNDLLHCYEIKSDGDTNGLQRLSRVQIKLYSKVMDRLSVIVTPKHLPSVRRCLPQNWGIYEYINNEVQLYRVPEDNSSIEPRAVAGLLWKDSALQLLTDNGLEKGFASKAKSYLHDHIAAQIDFPIIHEAVRNQLKRHRRSL